MKLLVFTDGGSRGNPGPSAIAFVITSEDGKVLRKAAKYIGEGTNNEAEYRGLATGLRAAKEMGADEVEVVMDSELVVRQIEGRYSVKSGRLRPLYEEAKALLDGFIRAKVVYKPRENPMTSMADALVNEELDTMAFARSLRKA
ncbi:MAG TPA: ribonuclease HI family protein [Methanomassiliicoccales archaeon]|nr:ribonuclease HI family protein [Methanomassiliicoccales archaeon]